MILVVQTVYVKIVTVLLRYVLEIEGGYVDTVKVMDTSESKHLLKLESLSDGHFISELLFESTVNMITSVSGDLSGAVYGVYTSSWSVNRVSDF